MLTYLLEVTLCWFIFYSIFFLALRKLTFFRVNRWYLLSTIVIGLLIPQLRHIELDVYQEEVAQVAPIVYVIKDAPAQFAVTVSEQVEQTTFNWSALLWSLYLIGLAYFLFRFFKGLYAIRKLYTSGTIKDKNNYTLVNTNQDHLPFSFFRYVFISDTVSLKEEYDHVIQHEISHVDGRHSLDVIFLEIINIVFWFNPMIYLYKTALRQTHEYLADEAVLSHASRKKYGTLLLKQSLSGLQIALTHQFFHSHIKKRINMMYQKKSGRSAWLKYVLALPVLALLFVVFSGYAQEVIVENNNPIDNTEELTNESIENAISIRSQRQIEITSSISIGLEGDFKINESGFSNEKHSLDLKNYTSKYNGDDLKPIWSNSLRSGDRITTDGPIYMLKANVELDKLSLDNGLSLYDLFSSEYNDKGYESDDLTYFMAGYGDENLHNVTISDKGVMSYELKGEQLRALIPITFFCIPTNNNQLIPETIDVDKIESGHSDAYILQDKRFVPLKISEHSQPREYTSDDRPLYYLPKEFSKEEFEKLESLDLYNLFSDKFPDLTYKKTELDYFIVDYDGAVFTDIEINDDGLVSYEADLSKTYDGMILTFVFVPKKPDSINKNTKDREIRNSDIPAQKINRSLSKEEGTTVKVYGNQKPPDENSSDSGFNITLTNMTQKDFERTIKKIGLDDIITSGGLSERNSYNSSNLFLAEPIGRKNIKKVLIIKNGLPQPRAKNLSHLQMSQEDILSMKMTKLPQSIDGVKDDFGIIPDWKNYDVLVEVYTKSAVKYQLSHLATGPKPHPLIVVNGFKVMAEDASDLNPDDITSIEIVKGSGAMKKYGKDGINGVIKISTRLKAEPQSAILEDDFDFPTVGVEIEAANKRREENLRNYDPIFFVDGEVVTEEDFENAQNSEDFLVLKFEGEKYGYKDVVEIITKRNDRPLFAVDGIIVRIKTVDLDPDDIKEINVIKDQAAIDKYGKEAKNGVIEIITKNPKKTKKKIAPKEDHTRQIRIESDQSAKDPLVVLDGVIIGQKNIKEEMNDLVQPSDIEHINIIKGKKALDKYGDLAVHGAVEIFTKKNDLANDDEGGKILFNNNEAKNIDQLSGEKPLFVIDGIKILRDQRLAKDLDPNDIKLINVLKGQAALDKYGDDGINGVVEITTKRPKKTRKRLQQIYTIDTVIIFEPETYQKEQHIIAHSPKDNSSEFQLHDEVSRTVLDEVLQYRSKTDNLDHTYEPSKSYQSKDISISGFINDTGNLEVTLETYGKEDIEVQMYNVLGKLIATQTIENPEALAKAFFNPTGISKMAIIVAIQEDQVVSTKVIMP